MHSDPDPTGAASPHSHASVIDQETGFVRELGLFDSTMIVIGAMIGSGIFIVSADMARNIGSPGWLLVAWVFAGLLTTAAALSYGELAAMMPKAGGMYIYLREAFSPLWGFLYGWTLFTVIQTGTIAAVAVGFSRFLGVLAPAISEQNYLIRPVFVSSRYAFSLSTAQLVGIAVIALLTWTNSLGIRYGKIVQNLFTSAKLAALFGLIVLGLILGWNHEAVAANFGNLWAPHDYSPLTSTLSAATAFGLFAAICVSQSGSLFSADSWHDVTFTAGEVRNPSWTMPRALALGTFAVMALYVLSNVAYLVTLPLTAIQHAPSDRVATATLEHIFPGWGSGIMAVAIMISAFGCMNGLILAGPRVYYAMAKHGLFFEPAGRLNRAQVPGWSLGMQGVWSALLVLPRTFDPETGQYGNLYSDLLNWVISAALLFYILTIAGVIRLRAKLPNAERPYRAWGYPVLPVLYIVGASAVLACLFLYRSSTTWPGLIIVIAGVPVYLLRSRAPAKP
jgi:APA family basic amino acid/polyamine antiporter